ncbi:MAG: hypothetical protein CMO81_10390 [Waddliaceae bacterium]|nr:hypothetical protein [Waddliaceae bacterium]
MSTTLPDDRVFVDFDQYAFTERINQLRPRALQRFDRFTKRPVRFNFIFFMIGVGQLATLLALLPSLFHSSVFAVGLAVLFLTLFSYFVLRLYFQAQQEEKLLELSDSYLDDAKEAIQYQEGVPEHHLALAKAAARISNSLKYREYQYFKAPSFFNYLNPLLRKLSCWWHWQNIFHFRELLLQAAIEEHIKLIKLEPTNLEVHAALANAYIMMSNLYADPRKQGDFNAEYWLAPERISKTMDMKFRETASRAIEEFKILNDYAPDDPWVHYQLAYSYHDLQMPEEEIKQYEIILKLRPNDLETRIKLGTLYFQNGLTAKGLQLYDQLKHAHPQEAESLIKFYGSYQAELS